MGFKKAGKDTESFFLAGKDMPWWLLGVSMVATTFSTDTPNLVTDLVRQNGVSGNWGWWAFLLTGMLTVLFMRNYGIDQMYLQILNFMNFDIAGKQPPF